MNGFTYRLARVAENSALASALTSYAKREGLDDFSSLTGFLETHPQSPWRAALLLDLGLDLADAGVNVTVLPATDLFLMGRNHDHAVPRGVADANFLLGHGVNCSLSTNNVMNPSTPYGDCSLIRLANLHANVLQVSLPHELCDCFEMITTRSARILNLADYGVAAGHHPHHIGGQDLAARIASR